MKSLIYLLRGLAFREGISMARPAWKFMVRCSRGKTLRQVFAEFHLACKRLYDRFFFAAGQRIELDVGVSPVSGPSNDANQALSYIVFQRDLCLFERKGPERKIVHQELCGNQLKYLLLGGMNFRKLQPDCMMPFAGVLQKALSPFNRGTSLHHIVVSRKEQPHQA